MATILNTQGQLVDMATGEVVGRAEGAPTSIDPLKAGAPEQITEGADKVKGLINNASWGFNSALFSLPDAAQRVIGRGLGLDDNQVFQFAKFFNRGEVAPKNSGERYARAIAGGVGAGLPFTGILGASAALRPAIAAATPATTVMSGVVKDAMDMIARSPKSALAMDVAFGAGWEGLRQAVEENVPDDQPSKVWLKELLPTAAFVGVPLALSGGFSAASKLANMSPTVQGAKFVKGQMRAPDLGDVEKEVLSSAPGVWKLPIIRVVPNMLIKNAERKLSQVFGPIGESKEAQEALKSLELALADPRFAQAGFVFDAAEKTMYTPLVQEKLKLLQQLGPKDLESVKERINQNQTALNSLFSNLAPQARQPVMDAFQAAQADRQAFFESLLRQKKDMTDAEIVAVSERLGPQNIDMLNNELRGVIMNRMEMDNGMRQNVLSRMGLKQATAPDGTPLPTRDKGESLFDSRDMEQAALSLIAKYQPERPSMRVAMPEPVRLLDNFVQAQLTQRARIERDATRQLADDVVDSQLAEMGRTGIDPELIKVAKNSVRKLVGAATEKTEKGKSGKGRLGLSDLVQASGARIGPDGTVSISVTPNTVVKFKPDQIKEDASRIAESTTKIDINVPEALDYLTAAQRFRNDALTQYNAAMSKGRVRQTDAQRILDTGNAVFRDVEGLVLSNTPRLKGEYEAMKVMIDDYKQVYDKTMPLLMSQTKKGGMEYLLPNEDLMRGAFKTAENLRDVSSILGRDEQSQKLLLNGAVDWLRTKGVVNKDGIVDPKMIRSVLNKNRNIVEALPEPIRAKLNDEVALADDYVKRLGEIDKRVVSAQDNELDRLLTKAVRPDADTRSTLTDALRDPAVMRKLVDAVGKDPEMLSSLRRSVYDVATEGAQGGGALKSFIEGNEKSLKVLFGGTNHLQDLKTLADLQRRVNAFANVTGQIPAFESLDQSLKRVFGFGVQFGTTTLREAMVGRISPETGALALMVRMTGSLENELYKRLFTKALESEEFAKSITHIATPADGSRTLKQLQGIGVTKDMVFGPSPVTEAARRAIQQETTEGLQQGQKAPVAGMEGLPIVPRESASSMLRKLPPAPPTRGVSFNPRLPTTPPKSAGPSQLPLMYPAMFPNDPISGLLQQRQAMVQGPQQ